VTTSFPVTRWEINLVTGQVTSAPWPPVTFDLTWAPDDFWTSFERVESIATFGPVKQHFRGAFSRVSASVSGTWDGHPLMNGSGELQDTQNNTIERQIIVEPNP
jgi:hypothetical protein